jgi:serine/threonine-protein kinase ATR
MFSAFWDAIAIEAVKDLVVRPQTTQYMADLLAISVSDFLVLTQSYSLPYLVLAKNIEVIRRISLARKDDHDFNACMEPTNLVHILALLLQQNVTDIEAFIMSLLKSVSPMFKELDLTDLMKIEPSYTAFHLLMAAGGADDTTKSRVCYICSSNFLVSYV